MVSQTDCREPDGGDLHPVDSTDRLHRPAGAAGGHRRRGATTVFSVYAQTPSLTLESIDGTGRHDAHRQLHRRLHAFQRRWTLTTAVIDGAGVALQNFTVHEPDQRDGDLRGGSRRAHGWLPARPVERLPHGDTHDTARRWQRNRHGAVPRHVDSGIARRRSNHSTRCLARRRWCTCHGSFTHFANSRDDARVRARRHGRQPDHRQQHGTHRERHGRR